jgi:site-specific DNA recombinase
VSAVAYCRISNDKAGAGLGVGRQASDCRELALRLGLGEPDVLDQDNDVSAYSGKRRRDYERLLEGLRSGRWDTLITWHVDRLCRNVRDLETLVDLVNGSNVAVHTVKGGEIDLETPEGRLQARILGTLARYESEHRSDRVRRKMQELAENGFDRGGQRPYGWNADGTLDLGQEAVVAELTRRVINGESCRSLAADLRARDIPSPRGARWSGDSVRSIVVRARNAGLIERGVRSQSGGEIVGVAKRPAIVSRDEWEAARAILTDPGRKVSPGNEPKRLMSGLMTCGICGLPVRSGGTGKGRPAIYRCVSPKNHLRRKIEQVDEVVETYVLALLEREDFGAPTRLEVPDALRGQADVIRVKLERLVAKYANDDIGRTDYLRHRDQFRAKLADLERQEALLRVPGPLEGITPEKWDALPLERKRAAVAYLVDVQLMPVPRGQHRDPSPELIKITPKY